MIRDEVVDSRVWTSGGSNSALYGQYRERHQTGGDRSPGSAQNEEHDYNASFHSRTFGYFKWHASYNPNEYGYGGYVMEFGSFSWDSNDELALIGQLREKFQQTSFNGGNFLGELPQTVALLSGKIELLQKTLAYLAGGSKPKFQRYRRGKRVPPRKKRPALKRDSLIANSWLEFSFGVKPLISDIYEIAEIASKQNVMRASVTARRKGRDGVVTTPYHYMAASGTVGFRKQIIARLKQAELPTFWEQFGLADPATIAWELLPWSFVVDWVLPIGKFIEAQSFARRMNAVFVITETQRTSFSVSLSKAIDGNYILTNMLSDRGSVVGVKRVITTTLPVPLPSLKSNLLGGKPLDRIANALSLIAQVFK